MKTGVLTVPVEAAGVTVLAAERAVLAEILTDAVLPGGIVIVPGGVDCTAFRDEPEVRLGSERVAETLGRCTLLEPRPDGRALLALTVFDETDLGERAYRLFRSGLVWSFTVQIVIDECRIPDVVDVWRRPDLARCRRLVARSTLLNYGVDPYAPL